MSHTEPTGRKQPARRPPGKRRGPDDPRPDPDDPVRRRRPRDAARKLEVEMRRENVATLLLSRVSYRQMANLLGVSKSQIGEDVQIVLKQWRARTGEHMDRHVAEQTAELDALTRAWMPVALDPSREEHAARAALVVHRAQERRAKLLGLDAPVRAELTGEGGGPIRVEGVDEARAAAVRALSTFEQRRSQQLAAESDAAENGQG